MGSTNYLNEKSRLLDIEIDQLNEEIETLSVGTKGRVTDKSGKHAKDIQEAPDERPE